MGRWDSNQRSTLCRQPTSPPSTFGNALSFWCSTVRRQVYSTGFLRPVPGLKAGGGAEASGPMMGRDLETSLALLSSRQAAQIGTAGGHSSPNSERRWRTMAVSSSTLAWRSRMLCSMRLRQTCSSSSSTMAAVASGIIGLPSPPGAPPSR